MNRIPLSVSECSDDHYSGLDIVNKDARNRFSAPGNKTCIDGLDQVSLTGLKNSDFQRSIKIDIDVCDPSDLPEGTECESDEVIHKYLAGRSLKFNYIDNYIDYSDIESPIKSI